MRSGGRGAAGAWVQAYWHRYERPILALTLWEADASAPVGFAGRSAPRLSVQRSASRCAGLGMRSAGGSPVAEPEPYMGRRQLPTLDEVSAPAHGNIGSRLQISRTCHTSKKTAWAQGFWTYKRIVRSLSLFYLLTFGGHAATLRRDRSAARGSRPTAVLERNNHQTRCRQGEAHADRCDGELPVCSSSVRCLTDSCMRS